MNEPVPVGEIRFTVYEPYRSVLPPRDLSPDKVEMAVSYFWDENDRRQYSDWVHRGCPSYWGPVDDGFFVCNEVRILRRGNEESRRQVPHAEFWRLVADKRPVVISSTTGRLIDGLRRINAHRAAGRRSPGIHARRRSYRSEVAEFIDVIRRNAGNPALPLAERVRLAERLRPAYLPEAAEEEDARNSGWPAGGFIDLSGALARGRPRTPAHVDRLLAAAAGVTRAVYAHWLAALREGDQAVQIEQANESLHSFWRKVSTAHVG